MSAATAAVAAPRRWLVLVAMTGSLSMIMLDQTVVAVALPSMARELPLILGFGPMQAGLAALPLILPLTLAAQVGGRWFDRAGVRTPVLTGRTGTAAAIAAGFGGAAVAFAFSSTRGRRSAGPRFANSLCDGADS